MLFCPWLTVPGARYVAGLYYFYRYAVSAKRFGSALSKTRTLVNRHEGIGKINRISGYK